MRSIRSRTLALVLGLLALGLSAISLVSYRDARHEIEELFDAELAQQARLLAGMIPAGMAPAARLALQQALDEAVVGSAAAGAREAEGAGAGEGDEARLQGHEYESKLGFVVLDDQGASLLRSASAPVAALARLLGASSSAQSAALPAAPAVPPAAAPASDPSAAASSSPGSPVAPPAASPAEPSTAAAAHAPAAPRRLDAHLAGYHTVAMDDGDWRLFVLRDARDRQWIVVGERQDVRGELVGRITLRSLLPDLVGLPLLALLVWLAIGWGLRPLARVVQRLKARDPDKLSPLEVDDVPQELEPVVASLDRLLLQLTALLERERRFLAYAAHELRTPLAVLRIHAQNALQAPDPADRDAALRQLEGGIERATRVVAQLLTLARLEPEAGNRQTAPIDLLALARRELAELTPLALERGQELALEVAGEADEGNDQGDASEVAGSDERGDVADTPGTTELAGRSTPAAGRARPSDFRLFADASGLGILLQNLVGNAVQHTPAGGRIRVLLEAGAEALTLRVQDSGPGVPPALRSKVFERFFRAGSGSGAGLGLAIVARIVELHGGTIALGDSPLGGLEVRVDLPRASRRSGLPGQAPVSANAPQ
ncbi:ATP-binding protein [Thauera sp. JM12B12]|uniref:ATP-binding protein n=1 Tax=Thauera sp. JM12B12 TaxID=3142262 RepID=UPI0031F358F8